MREIIRVVAIAAFVFMMAKDMKDIITEVSNSPTVKPFMDWIYPYQASENSYNGGGRRKGMNSGLVEEEEQEDVTSPYIAAASTAAEANSNDNPDEKTNLSPLEDPALDAVRRKLQLAGFTSMSTGEPASTSEFSDTEKTQIQSLKTHLTNVMQQWCLPKLVCELHASLSDRSALSDAERSLLALIKETSLGTMGEVVSRYHFAAHMGQLLSGMDGTGCHNLYPNCPLSGNKVLQLVKRVRIR